MPTFGQVQAESKRAVGVRWTIGDVSRLGFEALRASVWGARRVFGASARYVVCVNSVPIDIARIRTGALPDGVEWHESSLDLPHWLRDGMSADMAQGVGWKFAPLRMFPAMHELSLDNDCILWDMPAAMRAWLADESKDACLIAEDVKTCLGQFTDLCGPSPRNSGIRGLPPHFDIGRALRDVLSRKPVTLTSELDEQGLQVAALSAAGPLHVVSVADVAVCSPFPPHLPGPGHAGVHFVGLNARRVGWRKWGRPAEELIAENWHRHCDEVWSRVGG